MLKTIKKLTPYTSLVPKDLIVEVEEEIDEKGNIVRVLNKEEVVQKMQQLIDMGVRAISLKNSKSGGFRILRQLAYDYV